MMDFEFEPKNAAYWKRQANKADAEITKLRQRIKELEETNATYASYIIEDRIDEHVSNLEQRIKELEANLNTFTNAVDHVTADGVTRRAFSTSEGWAMIHKDRLHELECIEERSQAGQGEPVAEVVSPSFAGLYLEGWMGK